MIGSPITIKPYAGEPWGFDSMAWYYSLHNLPFNPIQFQSRISKMEPRGTPYIAVTPDIVYGGLKSLELSNSWITKLDNGWPWYLAVQDGMDYKSVEKSVTKYPYAGIFLGGGDDFKNHFIRDYISLAHRYGLKFHWGRCGTALKIRKAHHLGVDSCDSAFPHWIARRLEVVDRAVRVNADLVNYKPLLECCISWVLLL
jgi:hypothetical protein